VPDDAGDPAPDTAGQQPDTAGEFQVEMTATGGGDKQVFTVSGTWWEKGGGRLEAELHGQVSTAEEGEELSVTGSAAVQVHRILGVPIQVRRIELDLRFGSSHLWVRHNLSFGIQLLGLEVPGMLIGMAADGARWEEVSVRINPSQIVTVAKDITFARPDPTDPP
jgi:hypothetical protein